MKWLRFLLCLRGLPYIGKDTSGAVEAWKGSSFAYMPLSPVVEELHIWVKILARHRLKVTERYRALALKHIFTYTDIYLVHVAHDKADAGIVSSCRVRDFDSLVASEKQCSKQFPGCYQNLVVHSSVDQSTVGSVQDYYRLQAYGLHNPQAHTPQSSSSTLAVYSVNGHITGWAAFSNAHIKIFTVGDTLYMPWGEGKRHITSITECKLSACNYLEYLTHASTAPH